MSAGIVVIRIIIMMWAGKFVARIVEILMRRRVIVVHGTLALVFHELFVTMGIRVRVRAHAREWEMGTGKDRDKDQAG